MLTGLAARWATTARLTTATLRGTDTERTVITVTALPLAHITDLAHTVDITPAQRIGPRTGEQPAILRTALEEVSTPAGAGTTRPPARAVTIAGGRTPPDGAPTTAGAPTAN